MAKGGKLKAKEVKDFLNASYDKTPPNDLDGYILDKSLSTSTAKVYYNPQTNHAVVAHRGTQGTLDWGNNLAYALGAYEYTSRYKKGKSVQDKAEKKYGKSNISTLGHSQGSVLARKLGTDTKEVINVNPAYTFEKPAKNEYNIRSSTDVVSGLYAPVAKTREILFPKYSEKHDITIPSQSATDILGEHSYDILDRLGDKEIGVGAGNKISPNNIMKAGKRYSRLGYSGDDIDWIGGGVITTDNNCGAVGTPYVNQGTNPFGTRGAGFHDGHSSVDKYFKPPKGLRRGAGRDSESESDEESSSDEEMEGGKKNPFKSVSKAFNKVGKTLETGAQALEKGTEYINPMMWALKDKDTSKAMAQSGEITHDYLLPAVVSAGKPIYDATAITASTMLTGNPVLGKAVADTLWNEMVAKKGADPRQNQKSKELGELSSTFGQAVSKPYSVALGGYRLKAGMNGRTIGERLEDWWSPPKDDEAFYERTRNRRIKRAEQEELDAIARARELRRMADELERNAPKTRQQKEASAKEYGVFEEIGDDEADRAREHFERKQMREEDTEGKIARDDKDYVSVGKVGKGRKKGGRKKKGGASYDQIGRASAIRNFRGLDPTEEDCPEEIKRVLNDVVHSGDFEGDYHSIFEDLSFTEDKGVEDFLDAIEPTYANQYYWGLIKWAQARGIDPRRNKWIKPILDKILEKYPNAKRKIPNTEKWGQQEPVVQYFIDKNKRKPRGRRVFTADELKYYRTLN